MDFDEAADPASCLVSCSPIGRHRRYEHDDSVPSQQLRDERDAADVLVSILLRETQIAAQVLTDDVTVKVLRAIAAPGQNRGQRVCKSGLSRGAQACEPDGQPAIQSSPIMFANQLIVLLAEHLVQGDGQFANTYAGGVEDRVPDRRRDSHNPNLSQSFRSQRVNDGVDFIDEDDVDIVYVG